MDRKYDEAAARELLRLAGPLGDMVKIDSRGVWPDPEVGYLEESARELMRWKPVAVLRDREDAPDIVNTPALPFPFTASQLAAFMAHGVGVLLANTFGAWSEGPDRAAIDLIGRDHNRARDAVAAAYAAYRTAWARAAEASDSAPMIDALVQELLCCQIPAVEAVSARRDSPAAGQSELRPEPCWRIKPMQRKDDLRQSMFEYLRTADKMRAPPTARQMLSDWGLERPAGILKVTRDAVDYLDAKGRERTADLDAVAERISRMIERIPAR